MVMVMVRGEVRLSIIGFALFCFVLLCFVSCLSDVLCCARVCVCVLGEGCLIGVMTTIPSREVVKGCQS